MAERILTVGEIFARLSDLLRENLGPVAGCVVGLTVANIALDSISTGAGATLPAGIASLAAQYYLILYVFMFSAFAASWLAGVAIYSLLKPGVSRLAEVFA
ncbi:hypothetical protein GCM10009087_15260 [Sphingomonas oligophenolica]|uniref:Uncharacterized protein n=1 Tax=Sphingomonas oligophenolica TaxID=301154 RepID=A0ABU9Y309_9SPHN